MNRYGQIALDQHRNHRPTEHAQITDPASFFEKVGEEIQAEVTSRRDQILDRQRPGETIEDYRLRSYQALATAEELTLADHYLFQAETENPDDDPLLAAAVADLAKVNLAIHTA